jgi:nucleotide-binding universal stress UspA family protein
MVDYSSTTDDVVTRAAHLAAERGVGLRLVHAVDSPELDVSPIERIFDDNTLIVAAEQRLEGVADRAREQVAGLRVSAKVVVGAAAKVLIDESASASVIVVGPSGPAIG